LHGKNQYKICKTGRYWYSCGLFVDRCFFISLKKVIPVVINLLKDDGELLCLIKPQFEAGREKVGKHGVVRDKKVHEEVVKDIITFSLKEGLKIRGLDFSPIKGPEGNIEYLVYLSKKRAVQAKENFLSW